MHGTFEPPRETRDNHTVHRGRDIAFLAVPLLMAFAVVGLAIAKPEASVWIAEAAQAEFGGVVMPDAAPTQLADPAREIRSARAK